MGLPYVQATAMLGGALLALTACAIGPELDLTLHESDRGAVYLERITDRSFKAAHPIKIAPDIVSRILRGIFVRNDQRLLQTLIAGKPDAMQTFSNDDAAYLAPLLAEGLSRAASDQQVGFRVRQTRSPGYSESVSAGVGSSRPPLDLVPQESTSGFIYAYGRSLYVTLTQYRYRLEPPTTINMPNRGIPDTTGLANRTVLFIPESANRPNSYRDAQSTDATLVIDYELLATLPAEPDSASPPAAAAPQSPSPAKAESGQRDADLESLRKELREIKQKLAEQEAEHTLSQPKKPVIPRRTPTP